MNKLNNEFKEICFLYKDEPDKLGIKILISPVDFEHESIDYLLERLKEEAEKIGIKKIKCIEDFYNNNYDDPDSDFYIKIKDEPLSYISDFFPFTFKYDKEITVLNSKSNVERIVDLNEVKDMTIKEFKEKYLLKPEVILSYNEKILKDSDMLSNYMKTFTADKKLKIETPNQFNIKILIPDTNDEIELETINSNKILSIKKEISYRMNYGNFKLILRFNNQILEDSNSLSYYDIKSKVELTLSIIPKGDKECGGNKINDITKNKYKMIQPSQDAPKWRIGWEGINIEGICKNENCEACNYPVICPIKLPVFDFIEDSNLIVCPICNYSIEAKTFVFYDCFYSFSGLKKDHNSNKIKVKKQEWEEVKKEFKYFIYEESDIVEWIRLKVLAKFSNKNISKKFCGVCKNETNEKEESIVEKECSHKFHESCFLSINSTCNLCN